MEISRILPALALLTAVAACSDSGPIATPSPLGIVAPSLPPAADSTDQPPTTSSASAALQIASFSMLEFPENHSSWGWSYLPLVDVVEVTGVSRIRISSIEFTIPGDSSLWQFRTNLCTVEPGQRRTLLPIERYGDEFALTLHPGVISPGGESTVTLSYADETGSVRTVSARTVVTLGPESGTTAACPGTWSHAPAVL